MHLIQQSASSGLYHDIPNLYKFIYHDQTEGLPAPKKIWKIGVGGFGGSRDPL